MFSSTPGDGTKPTWLPEFLRTFCPLHVHVDLLLRIRLESLTWSSDRIAVKIATTTAGVQAAKILSGEGIKTLGTTLFSVPQAIAAAQAGMFAISLYYNGKHFTTKRYDTELGQP